MEKAIVIILTIDPFNMEELLCEGSAVWISLRLLFCIQGELSYPALPQDYLLWSSQGD